LPGFDNTPFAAAADTIAARVHSTHEFCRELASVPLQFQPGTQYLYGVSYDVLGCIIEDVSGKPLSAFLTEKMFKPLGMNSTSFYVSGANLHRLSAIYALQDGQVVEKRAAGEDPQPNYLSGGGGLRTTVNDFLRFCQMLANGGELGGRRILSANSVTLMTSNQVGKLYPSASEGKGWGLGVETRTDGHAGPVYGWAGFHGNAFFVFSNAKTIAILMTQQFPSQEPDLREQFEEAAARDIGRH